MYLIYTYYVYRQGRMERGKEGMLLLREHPEAWFRYLQPGDVFCLVLADGVR